MKIRSAILVFSLFILASCSGGWIFEPNSWSGPTPHTLPKTVDGPIEYQEGFKDGCQSGLATYGPMHYKMYYTYYQNYSMLKDKYYVTSWHEAFDFCRHFILKYYTTGEDDLISNLTIRFFPAVTGMPEGFDALIGQKKPFFARVHGFDIDSAHGPDYKQGWEDGCETGMTVYSDNTNKDIQRARGKSFVRDVTMVGNQNYESAWWDAYNFCRQSFNTQINQWESDWWGILDLQ